MPFIWSLEPQGNYEITNDSLQAALSDAAAQSSNRNPVIVIVMMTMSESGKQAGVEGGWCVSMGVGWTHRLWVLRFGLCVFDGVWPVGQGGYRAAGQLR